MNVAPDQNENQNVSGMNTAAALGTINAAAATVGNSISAVKESVGNAINEFSSKNVVDASTEFLEVNSLIAKFVFIILVLIAFVILLNLGVMLIAYLTEPSRSPYLIYGYMEGAKYVVVNQDPKNTDSITIHRSNNQETGMEFTWSVWLRIDDADVENYKCIFVKGTVPNGTNNSGISPVNNGPGLYVKKVPDSSFNEFTLRVIMDTAAESGSVSSDDAKGLGEIIDISNIPIKKWIHVAIRLENKIMDVYVNGTVAARKIFMHMPRQNYNNVHICPNGGFSGALSNLRYFDHALNVIQVNNVMNNGVNLSPTVNGGKPASTGFSYLSQKWYNSKL